MWFLYILGGIVVLIFAYSAIKLVFWEIPAEWLQAVSFPDYFKKVAYSILGLSILFGVFYLGGKYEGFGLILGLVFIVGVVVAMVVSSSRTPDRED
jgi:uncharacterized membrane protein YesL